MSNHKKAQLFDQLLNDFGHFISEIESHQQEISTLKETLKGDPNDETYYAQLAGAYQGQNHKLFFKIAHAKGNFSSYQQS